MDDKISLILDGIADRGWSVTENFLSLSLAENLNKEIKELWKEGNFKKAGIGRGEELAVRPEIRTDRIHWLRKDDLSPAAKEYWDIIHHLKDNLNRNFFLNLVSFEAHFAAYPPGSFYKKHLDQFKDVRHRLISCILYLNEKWELSDEGQLRIYEENSASYSDIWPRFNTFVCFRSDTVYHEVLPTNKQRYSLTGWLRVRDFPI